MDTLEEAVVVSAVNKQVPSDIGHLAQGLVNLVGLYRNDHRQLVSASFGDDGAYLVAPYDQFENNIAVRIVVRVVESPFVVVGVAVVCVQTVDAVDHPAERHYNCACTAVGVAVAEDGGLDVA